MLGGSILGCLIVCNDGPKLDNSIGRVSLEWKAFSLSGDNFHLKKETIGFGGIFLLSYNLKYFIRLTIKDKINSSAKIIQKLTTFYKSH